jgi:hypothetical protein
MSSTTAERPGRARRLPPQSQSPWDQDAHFLGLKDDIKRGAASATLMIDEAEAGPRLGLRDPVRTAKLGLQRWLKAEGLAQSYRVWRYRTTEGEGRWALVVERRDLFGAESDGGKEKGREEL